MSGWLIDAHRMRQRTGWTPVRVSLVHLLALAPPAVLRLIEGGAPQVALMLAALAASLFWEVGFALVRRHQPSWHLAGAALILAILVPPSVPLWQVALAVSFGVVFGELAFGGRGYGIVSAAAAGCGFLLFSFSGTELSPADPVLAFAALPGAVLLLLTGLVSWRVVGAALAVLLAAGATQMGLEGARDLVAASLFGLIFLIGDPVSGASTRSGRVIYGALAGFLIVLFAGDGGSIPSAIVFAAILASVFAPLIDHLAVAVHVRRRRARHG